MLIIIIINPYIQIIKIKKLKNKKIKIKKIKIKKTYIIKKKKYFILYIYGKMCS